MKCVEEIGSGRILRTINKHATMLTGSNGVLYTYASKIEWKAGGRVRIGPQDEPTSVHPRKGWANRGSKRGRW